MSEFTAANSEAIAQALSGNLGGIAESLNQCFGGNVQLVAGEAAQLGAAPLDDALEGPGVIVAITVNGQALAMLIPASLPLPAWYRAPGESESSRLQTLAMECSLNLLPADLEAAEYATVAIENLAATIAEAAPAEWARRIDLSVFPAGELVEGASPLAILPVVWPVTNLAALQPVAASEPAASNEPAIEAAESSAPQLSPAGLNRLLKLPVTVVVRLAEKKIELGQLLALTPGALVTFNKSCEALLDLYVNNVVYCRGEAVKIGENFGLKVNQMGAATEREERVL